MTLARQMRKELSNFRAPHFARVTLAVVEDETADPVDISLFGAVTVVTHPDGGPDCVQKARWPIRG